MEAFDVSILDAKPAKVTRPKVKPGDTLLERQACLRRLEAETPTIEELQKHADKYGSSLVVETAAELGYGYESLMRLQEHCDLVDVSAHRERYGPKRPLPKTTPAEVRVKILLGLEDEKDDN